MKTPDFVARQLELLRAYVDAGVQGIVSFSRVAATTASGEADGDTGWPADGGDPSSGQETSRRMEPWGVHGRPVTGVQSAIMRVMGGAAQALRVGVWTNRHGRQNLKEGETQLYCKVADCEVWLDENGTLRINTPAGQDVVVNQGTAKVAVHGDSTAGHTHTIPSLTVTGGATSTGVTGSSTDTINVTASRRFKA